MAALTTKQQTTKQLQQTTNQQQHTTKQQQQQHQAAAAAAADQQGAAADQQGAAADHPAAYKEVKRQVRVLRSALEEKLQRELKDDDPALAWLPRQAGDLLSRYKKGSARSEKEMANASHSLWRTPVLQGSWRRSESPERRTVCRTPWPYRIHVGAEAQESDG